VSVAISAFLFSESGDDCGLAVKVNDEDDYGTHPMTIVRAVRSGRILEILSLDPDDVREGCSRTAATGDVD
jgi:hypothetical protein